MHAPRLMFRHARCARLTIAKKPRLVPLKKKINAKAQEQKMAFQYEHDEQGNTTMIARSTNSFITPRLLPLPTATPQTPTWSADDFPNGSCGYKQWSVISRGKEPARRQRPDSVLSPRERRKKAEAHQKRADEKKRLKAEKKRKQVAARRARNSKSAQAASLGQHLRDTEPSKPA